MRPLEDSSIIKVKLPIWQTMEIFSRRMEIKASIRSSGTQLHLLKWIAIVTVHDEQTSSTFGLTSVWPDLTIYWTLGNFLKPLAIIKLSQSPPFLGNFCKDVKIIHFSSETILGQLLSGHTGWHVSSSHSTKVLVGQTHLYGQPWLQGFRSIWWTVMSEVPTTSAVVQALR